MQITVIRGDLNTPGSIIEIPWSQGNLGVGPIYRVDPKTRKCMKDLQQFEITGIHADGRFDLKPVNA
jgi:hypothetical protein